MTPALRQGKTLDQDEREALREAARAGDLDTVRILLDTGVQADTHRSGALAVARGDDVRALLSGRGAKAAENEGAGAADTERCPDKAVDSAPPG